MGVKATLLELYNPLMVSSGIPANGGLAAGQVAAAAGTATSSTTVSLGAGNSWIVGNMPVYDVTSAALIGKVATYTANATTATLSANASSTITSGDVLQFGLTPSDLAAGETAGADVRGLVQVAQLHLSEAIAIINYLTTDVITSSQDATLNTVLTSAVTSLS